MPNAYIVDATRTAVGRRNGGFAASHPADMAAHVIKTVVGRHDVDPAEIEHVILGCLDNMGSQAGDIARTAAVAAGLPESVAWRDHRPPVWLRTASRSTDACNRRRVHPISGHGIPSFGQPPTR
jgi:hypothetical protein